VGLPGLGSRDALEPALRASGGEDGEKCERYSQASDELQSGLQTSLDLQRFYMISDGFQEDNACVFR
jgi:hypothetical protein